MNEMIERVAQKLAAGDQHAHMPEYRRRAREIIAVMRVPTFEMVHAAANMLDPGTNYITRMWVEMIDAALKE